MSDCWPEVQTVRTENRHELILSGKEISERIHSNGLDKTLFQLNALNLLRISDTRLDILPDDISQLNNLQTLLLHSNELHTITPKLGGLVKLKTLDLSNNHLEQIPEGLFDMLSELNTLNISSNKLVRLSSSFENTTKLSVLNAANNKLEIFPDICYTSLIHLSEVRLNGNCMGDIPGNVNLIPCLKILDLSSNWIGTVPGELADISKLKDLNLKDNLIVDKRFVKLIDQSRTMKQVLDYVRQHCPRMGPDKKGAAGKKAAGGGKKTERNRHGSSGCNQDEETADSKADGTDDEEPTHIIKLSRTTDVNKPPDVRITNEVKKVRPYILCCVLRNLKFDEKSIKKFIQLQTKLHETVCEKRNAATIATHDLDKLKTDTDLTYSACAPTELKIKPLARSGQEYTGAKLYEQLQLEAEAHRKEKKRNTYSGIHRYLYLLEGKPVYPFLMDSSGRIVSFPPITNSDDTKISADTKSILVEVTSATGQDVCRRVLDTVLRETLLLGIGGTAPDQNHFLLTIERVKINDMEGNMKAVYPSRADLAFTSDVIKVIRD